MTPKPLKLLAIDGPSLEVISACLQDALTRLTDMTYLPRERRFVATFNRFMWEAEKDGPENPGKLRHRIRTGVHFDGVMGAQVRDIIQEDEGGFLELLAIESEGGGENEDFAITLVMAGGGRIKLRAECIDCVLTDMDEPWTTTNKPDHGLDETDDQ